MPITDEFAGISDMYKLNIVRKNVTLNVANDKHGDECEIRVLVYKNMTIEDIVLILKCVIRDIKKNKLSIDNLKE